MLLDGYAALVQAAGRILPAGSDTFEPRHGIDDALAEG